MTVAPLTATVLADADDSNAGAFVGVAQEAGARILTYGTDRITPPAIRNPKAWIGYITRLDCTEAIER